MNVTAHASTLFSTLALHPSVLANLSALGYLNMTAVQAASLPLALSGRDLVAQAATGSGKTVAFGLALLNKLEQKSLKIQALVLCPTRELADQVAVETRRLARSEDNIKVVTLVGGVPARGQIASLERGAHVAVGTPGRVLDLIRRNVLNLSGLRMLVFDEADRMLEMGFAEDIEAIAGACPPRRQTLMFSATFPPDIEDLSRQFMRDAQRIEVKSETTSADVEQYWYEVDADERLMAVVQLLRHFRPERTLAFCNTRQRCRELVELLNRSQIQATALHGELEQREREQVLIQFANRSCSVLVATDVAARGLDIAQLEAVINVEVTHEPDVHTHRVGRTGRAGAAGLVFNLVAREELARSVLIESAQGAPLIWRRLSELKDVPSAGLSAGMTTLQISGGRKDKIRPGDLLGALTKDFGFSAAQIGKINVTEQATYVAVDSAIAAAVVAKLNAGMVKGRRVRARSLP
jgi:ATP-independent RNA helicase DbpA